MGRPSRRRFGTQASRAKHFFLAIRPTDLTYDSRPGTIPYDHFDVRTIQPNEIRELVEAHRKLTLTAQVLSWGGWSGARIRYHLARNI